jgi:4-hydroxy-3-polyprenylbenzoate decarboxylase
MPESLFISEGILDALDHSSPETLVGGKLGIDLTKAHKLEVPTLLRDEELYLKVKELIPEATALHQFMTRTSNPITVIAVDKKRKAREYFESLISLSPYMRIVVFVDTLKNDITNAYMLVWRVTNNMDAQRDVFVSGLMVGIDGTNKNALDGFYREWPDDVDCTQSVVSALKSRGIWNLEESLNEQYQL